MTERTITSLCQRSHEISRSKGWYDGQEKDPRSIRLITLLMQSELIEALEEWRSNHKFDEIYYSYEEGGISMKLPPGHMLKDDAPVAKYKPEGILVELADFVIRVAQRAGSDGVNLERMTADASAAFQGAFSADLEEMLATEMANTSMAYVCTTPGGDAMLHKAQMQFRDSWSWLALAVAGVWSFCNQNKLDLWSAIELKERFNSTRPQRHGGKKA